MAGIMVDAQSFTLIGDEETRLSPFGYESDEDTGATSQSSGMHDRNAQGKHAAASRGKVESQVSDSEYGDDAALEDDGAFFSASSTSAASRSRSSLATTASSTASKSHLRWPKSGEKEIENSADVRHEPTGLRRPQSLISLMTPRKKTKPKRDAPSVPALPMEYKDAAQPIPQGSSDGTSSSSDLSMKPASRSTTPSSVSSRMNRRSINTRIKSVLRRSSTGDLASARDLNKSGSNDSSIELDLFQSSTPTKGRTDASSMSHITPTKQESKPPTIHLRKIPQQATTSPQKSLSEGLRWTFTPRKVQASKSTTTNGTLSETNKKPQASQTRRLLALVSPGKKVAPKNKERPPLPPMPAMPVSTQRETNKQEEDAFGPIKIPANAGKVASNVENAPSQQPPRGTSTETEAYEKVPNKPRAPLGNVNTNLSPTVKVDNPNEPKKQHADAGRDAAQRQRELEEMERQRKWIDEQRQDIEKQRQELEQSRREYENDRLYNRLERRRVSIEEELQHQAILKEQEAARLEALKKSLHAAVKGDTAHQAEVKKPQEVQEAAPSHAQPSLVGTIAELQPHDYSTPPSRSPYSDRPSSDVRTDGEPTEQSSSSFSDLSSNSVGKAAKPGDEPSRPEDANNEGIASKASREESSAQLARPRIGNRYKVRNSGHYSMPPAASHRDSWHKEQQDGLANSSTESRRAARKASSTSLHVPQQMSQSTPRSSPPSSDHRKAATNAGMPKDETKYQADRGREVLIREKPAPTMRSCLKNKRLPRPTRNITFSNDPRIVLTWDSSVYDRQSECATCDLLTPELASIIKAEINHFKMYEMRVHPMSHRNTHLCF